MGDVKIREEHEYTEEQSRDLFLSVEWPSGHYPDRLVLAMRNFELFRRGASRKLTVVW